jgi:hypothetical protein
MKNIPKQYHPAVRKLIKKAREDGEISGAKKMLDFIVLSGFEIDGVDYLKLDSVFERAEYLLNELKPTKPNERGE